MDKVNCFLEALKRRRSRYVLTDECPISDKALTALIAQAVKLTPSAFNSQGARVVLLLGGKHKLFWQLTKDALKKIVPPEKFAPTQEKIASFAAAYGTILFFEDWTTVADLQQKFPTYKDNFPLWAYQSNGMLELVVWTGLAQAGIGASLQHYNPLVNEAVAQAFHIPKTWKLLAQMPFGEAVAEPEDKPFLPVEARLRVEK